MRNLLKITVLLLFTFNFSLLTFGQTPNQFKYQAVLRDASGNILANQSVAVDISILQGSASGTSVFDETHNVTTTAQGLINLNIGSVEDLSTVDFSADIYFIEITVDGTLMGTSQLLSVPYALHAKTAETIAGGHYVGELYGGGIIFWLDQTGEHGLIASLDDLDGGSGVEWGLYGTDVSNCESMTDGAANTAAIIAAGPAAGTAAVLCNNYTGGGFTDWYLPSNRELYLLCSQDVLIDQILDNDGNSATNGFSQEYTAPIYSRYWSSTEYDGSYAWYYDFGFGSSGSNVKTHTYRVRAVRAF